MSYLVAAANATLLPKLGSPRMKDNVQASQTVLMGDLVLGSTLWKNLCPGIPPSRAKAYIIRELDVIENTLVRGGSPVRQPHGRRRRGGDLPAEVHTADDNHHQNDGTLWTHRIKEDLGHRLTSRGVDRSVQILDRKQQSKDEEPTQNGGDSNSHDNTDGSRHGSIVSFLCHLHPRFNHQRKRSWRGSRTCALASNPVRVY